LVACSQMSRSPLFSYVIPLPLLLGRSTPVTPAAASQRRRTSPGMSLNSRYAPLLVQTGPSVNMKPVPRRSTPRPAGTRRWKASVFSIVVIVCRPSFVAIINPAEGAPQKGASSALGTRGRQRSLPLARSAGALAPIGRLIGVNRLPHISVDESRIGGANPADVDHDPLGDLVTHACGIAQL